MSDSTKPDRWNSLLETLGVPVSEEKKPLEPPAAEATGGQPSAPTKPQPVSLLPPAKTKAAPKPKPAAPAAKSPSYWSRIAGALGLGVPAPAVEEPKAQTTAEPKGPRTEEPKIQRT